MPRWTALAVVAATALAGCSTKPRDFRPELSAAPADQAGYEAVLGRCRTMVAEGRRSGFGGAAAAAGAGAAAGYGTGAALFAGTGGSLAATAGAASLAVVAMPVVGVVAAIGVSRAVRRKKEAEVRTAIETCLNENGYAVSEWRLDKAPTRRDAAERDRPAR